MTVIERGITLARRRSWAVLWLFLALLLVVVLGDQLVPAGFYALSSLWDLAPVVLLGLLVTAYLTASGSIGLLVSAFKSRPLGAIVLISLIGAVLPVCGITVLPLVIGLMSAGTPLAPVMAFLLSSAVTDPQMLAITAATLGWQFALGKTLAALAIGLMAGFVTWALVTRGCFAEPTRESSLLEKLTLGGNCCASQTLLWRFWRDAGRRRQFMTTAWSMVRIVVLWLAAAFVAEYFLKLYLPEQALAGLVGEDQVFAVPLAAFVGVPLYLDGNAALPFVRGLIDRGMAEDAAMAFLIAGGIISAWTAIPVFALFRLSVFSAYVLMAFVGSMLAGWAYGLFLLFA